MDFDLIYKPFNYGKPKSKKFYNFKTIQLSLNMENMQNLSYDPIGLEKLTKIMIN